MESCFYNEGDEMKTNKEIADSLTAYFLDQDPKTVARILANMMIDFNRVRHMHLLPEDERECLLERIEKNVDQLQSFIKYGPQEPLTFGTLK